LRSYRTVVQLIAGTKTETRLTVRAELDEHTYPKGVKVSDAQLAAVKISRHRFHRIRESIQIIENIIFGHSLIIRLDHRQCAERTRGVVFLTLDSRWCFRQEADS
jgi:hypothetical protein